MFRIKTSIDPEDLSTAYLVTKNEIEFPENLFDFEIEDVMIHSGYLATAGLYSRILSLISNRGEEISPTNHTKRALDETNQLFKDAIKAHNASYRSAVLFGFSREKTVKYALESATRTFAPARHFAKKGRSD